MYAEPKPREVLRVEASMLGRAALLVSLCTAACTGRISQSPVSTEPVRPDTPNAGAADYDRVLERFAAQDAAGWDRASCTEVAREFERVAARDPHAKQSALYNAGLAYERCSFDELAREAYREAGTHRARAKLLLLDHAAGASLDHTIEKLGYLVVESKFRHPDLLVALAALQMRRRGPGDADAARASLQRALAIDDAYMPALNLLALGYLASARNEARASGLVVAGAERRSTRRQMLDLAALVASQAIQKRPDHAPIHNTAGLIAVELADYNAAIRSFRRARELDPRFFEAHMNFAAVSFLLRGYDQARDAYRAALALRSDDYEAHLGLALALRAQAKPGSTSDIAEAKRHLETAKRLAPARPEAYFNEALLVEELEARHAQGKRAISELRRARELYAEFSKRAGPAHRDALQRAAERSSDIERKIEFLAAER